MSRQRPSDLDRLPDRITPERELVAEGDEPPHHSSITDIMDRAAETGVSPLDAEDEAIPGDDDSLRAGDPDVDPLLNEYSGEEAPGGPNPTPDQNDVDAIGRLYGVSESDESELVLGEELIERRDRARWENDPRSKDETEE
jgi:hypothetical protein